MRTSESLQECDECLEWAENTLTEYYERPDKNHIVGVYTQQVCTDCVKEKGYFHCSYCEGVFEFAHIEELCPSCTRKDLPRCENCSEISKEKTWGLCQGCFDVMALLPTLSCPLLD